MTQLELPPISIARYLDLVKRRRWQVLPMSLLGLLVGALIAFFIPRYYVATTQVVYSGSVLDPKARTESDPMYLLVRGATLSVPATIPRTLEELKWIGTSTEDPSRQATIDRFTARTTVTANPVERGRTDFVVTIVCRDPDGQRAADFANKLREMWAKGLTDGFEEEAAVVRRQAREQVTAQQRALDDVLLAIAQHERTYGIETGEDQLGQPSIGDLTRKALVDEKAQLAELEAEIHGLETEIEQLEVGTRMGGIPRTIRVNEPIADDPQLSELVALLMKDVEYKRRAMEEYRPGTELYETNRRDYESLRAQLQQIVPQGVESGLRPRDVDNPEFKEALKALGDKRGRLAVLSAQAGTIRNSVTALEIELEKAPEVRRIYDKLKTQKTVAMALLEQASQTAKDYDDLYERARANPSLKKASEATPPPAPSDPNVFIVALIGSVLGLAIAIGLVLLLDIVRSTFKTVEDVNFGLRLPVLGMMSHLETEEVRRDAVKSRRVISIVIAVFLVLVLSIVAVYYIAPLRLPPMILRVLDTILGGDSAH